MSGDDTKELKSHALSYEEIMDTAKDVIEKCQVLFPGKSKPEKKKWCITKVTEVLEVFDNYIPVIGSFLDLGIVDNLEKHAVSMLVDWAWNNFLEDKDDEAAEPLK